MILWDWLFFKDFSWINYNKNLVYGNQDDFNPEYKFDYELGKYHFFLWNKNFHPDKYVINKNN